MLKENRWRTSARRWKNSEIFILVKYVISYQRSANWFNIIKFFWNWETFLHVGFCFFLSSSSETLAIGKFLSTFWTFTENCTRSIRKPMLRHFSSSFGSFNFSIPTFLTKIYVLLICLFEFKRSENLKLEWKSGSLRMLKFARGGKFPPAFLHSHLVFLYIVEGDIHLQLLSIKSFHFDSSREYKLNVHFLPTPSFAFVRLFKKEVKDVFREIREKELLVRPFIQRMSQDRTRKRNANPFYSVEQ